MFGVLTEASAGVSCPLARATQGNANPHQSARSPHDRTLPPVEALGRIRDAFREYDDGVA